MITRWYFGLLAILILTSCAAPEQPKIVYTSPQDTRLGEIYVMQADGSQPTRLTYFSPDQQLILSKPRWSPNREHIAFVANSLDYKEYSVYVMRQDGSNLMEIANATADFSWAPDSQFIAYAKHDNIHLINIISQEVMTITTLPLEPSRVQWSPAGNKLLCWGKQNDQLGWFVMDTDGKNIRQLPIDFTAEPVWMSDGQGILFTQFTASTEADELFLYDLEDDEIHSLVTMETFQSYGVPIVLWPLNSPDGQHIVFMSLEVGGRVLYVIDRNGSNLRRLVKEGLNDDIFTMTWSPDSQTLAYESGDTLKIINIQSGAAQKLVYFETWHTEPNWSSR